MRAIEKYLPVTPEIILDIGTAEGRMLGIFRERYPACRCLGIEYSSELIHYGIRIFPDLSFIQGDATLLPCRDGFSDVVVATAVLEHVNEPGLMVREIKRILKPGGIAIITTPDPFWESVATRVGHLEDDQHLELFTLEKLEYLFKNNGFQVVECCKFMLSPIGLPMELTLEKILRKLGMDFLMANQLIVARK